MTKLRCDLRSPLMKTLDWSVETLGRECKSTGFCIHLQYKNPSNERNYDIIPGCRELANSIKFLNFIFLGFNYGADIGMFKYFNMFDNTYSLLRPHTRTKFILK